MLSLGVSTASANRGSFMHPLQESANILRTHILNTKFSDLFSSFSASPHIIIRRHYSTSKIGIDVFEN